MSQGEKKGGTREFEHLQRDAKVRVSPEIEGVYSVQERQARQAAAEKHVHEQAAAEIKEKTARGRANELVASRQLKELEEKLPSKAKSYDSAKDSVDLEFTSAQRAEMKAALIKPSLLGRFRKWIKGS